MHGFVRDALVQSVIRRHQVQGMALHVQCFGASGVSGVCFVEVLKLVGTAHVVFQSKAAVGLVEVGVHHFLFALYQWQCLCEQGGCAGVLPCFVVGDGFLVSG